MLTSLRAFGGPAFASPDSIHFFMSFRFRLVTPERTLIDAEMTSVTLPTPNGEIEVLSNHAELATLLVPGIIRYVTKERQTEEVAVSGGFLHVSPDKLATALTETAERGEELDLSVIEEAKQRAETIMKQAVAKDEASYATAAAALQRELARFKVATKHRHARSLPVFEQGSIKEGENEE